MEEGFKRRATRVQERLCDEDTAFVLVASPRRDTIAEATYFAEKLTEGGIAVRSLIVNRMHPRFDDGLADAPHARADSLAAPDIARKRVGEGKSGSCRVALGCGPSI